jgi:hypothetical protein
MSTRSLFKSAPVNLPRRRLLAASMAVSAGLLMGAGPVFAARRGGSGTVVLSEREQADLLFMREEEKVARDVYLMLYQVWHLPIFSTIATSEQQHMDAILNLLNAYGLVDPVGTHGVGAFTDLRLQTLHDQLVARGKTSALEALRVGGFIEETDMTDLQAAIDAAAPSNLDRVYGNLLSGSRSHLQAFASQIKSMTGQPYVAQVLPQSMVNSIIGF